MAKTVIQKEMTDEVENFIGLWNRYYTLYIEGTSKQDITLEKENEFLKFQGTMVEQLVKVLEIEGGRFDVHDKVMAVINDVLSLEYYMKMSEFQTNRLKKQWQEALEELEKLYRFCDTYDPKMDKVKRIVEVKRKNPYWDPTVGGMGAVLGRLVAAPITFFEGIKPGVIGERMGSFSFFLFFIPTVIIFGTLAIANFAKARVLGEIVCIELGIVHSSDTGLAPGLLTAVVTIGGFMLICFLLTLVVLILHHLFTLFMHIGFKITGAKEDYGETYKVVTYGSAPLIAIITAPYALFLHIVGASKVHKYHFALAAIGWILGIIFFAVVILGVTGLTFYLIGGVRAGENYLYLREDVTFGTGDEKQKYYEGAVFAEYEKTKKKKKPYKVKEGDTTRLFEKGQVKEVEFVWADMPSYMVDRARYYVSMGRKYLDETVEEFEEDKDR